MKLSKLVPIWLVVLAVILLVVSLVLRAQHNAIMRAYSPTSAIESMKMGESLGWLTTTTYIVTVGLWVGILLTVASRVTKR